MPALRPPLHSRPGPRALALLGLLALPLTLTAAPREARAAPSPLSTRMPTVVEVPEAARAAPGFDPVRATDAWLATIPAEARARSDAYFEGGYWLLLWNFLVGAAVALLLLETRLSARLRDLAERVTSRPALQTALYFAQYLVVGTLLQSPLTIYEGFVREHQYGLANQTFPEWLGDQGKGLLVGLVFGSLLVTALFGLVRWLQKSWWIWGAALSVAFIIFGALIAPVFITPLFNKVNRIEDPKITGPILSLARASGIPASDVYQIDASKQSSRMSANVSGLGSTLRITLNDNLLSRATPGEVQMVMGHEMGHYVLGHVEKFIVWFGVLSVLAFAFLRWALDLCLRRFGERWQVRSVGDPAVLPLALLLLSVLGFFGQPLINTLVRTQETEADLYGLNASAQPDGMAQAAIHLGEYRKMEPGKLEEWVFFDHPSGRNRIYAAMRWKAEHLSQPCNGR